VVYICYCTVVRFKYIRMILGYMGYTNIRLRTETRDRLKKIGFKGDSYDDIINRLIDRDAIAGHDSSAPRREEQR